VTTKSNNSITRGFAAVEEPHVAVCLLPGTEIAFDENVECEPSFGLGILPNKKIGQRLARFRQINMDNAVTHHDALEFPDGHVVLLTRLCVGQRATVLRLPAAARPEPGRIRRRRRLASLRFLPDGCARNAAETSVGRASRSLKRPQPRLRIYCSTSR